MALMFNVLVQLKPEVPPSPRGALQLDVARTVLAPLFRTRPAHQVSLSFSLSLSLSMY